MTKPWFVRTVRRSPGFGIRLSPCAWQGWAATLAFVAAIIGLTSLVSPWLGQHMPRALSILVTVVLVTVLVVCFVLVAYLKSAPADAIDRN